MKNPETSKSADQIHEIVSMEEKETHKKGKKKSKKYKPFKGNKSEKNKISKEKTASVFYDTWKGTLSFYVKMCSGYNVLNGFFVRSQEAVLNIRKWYATFFFPSCVDNVVQLLLVMIPHK